MDAFLAAAMERGAYQKQVTTAAAAVACAVEKQSADDLQAILPVLSRLLVNISCRLEQRKPATLRPLRKELSALHSQVRAELKRFGAADSGSNSGSPRKPRGLASADVTKCPQRAMGVRHLCEHGCYFRAYEGSRLLHAFLAAASALGYSSEALSGWQGATRHRVAADDEPSPSTPSSSDEVDGGEGGGDEVIGPARRLEEANEGGVRSKRQRVGETAANRSQPRRKASRVGVGSVYLVSPAGREYPSIADALSAIDADGGAAAAPVAHAHHFSKAQGGGAQGGRGGGAASHRVVHSRYFGGAAADAASKAATTMARDYDGSGAAVAHGAAAHGAAARGAAGSELLIDVLRRQNHAPQPLPPPPTPPPLLKSAAAAGPWRPPHSPFGLLEELMWDRPWALLVCCILLNQTTRAQVDPILARLLSSFPDAASLAAANVSAVEEILRPLGLHRRRARTLVTLSEEFLKGRWRQPEELPGIGKYASDAHELFCCGRWREVEPQDHALRWYVDWLRTLDRQGWP